MLGNISYLLVGSLDFDRRYAKVTTEIRKEETIQPVEMIAPATTFCTSGLKVSVLYTFGYASPPPTEARINARFITDYSLVTKIVSQY